MKSNLLFFGKVIVLEFFFFSLFFQLWIGGSYLAFDNISLNICVSNTMIERNQSIDRVIKIFNRNGIKFKRSCEDLDRIYLTYGKEKEYSYATARSHGFCTLKNSSMFVPVIFPLQREVIFNWDYYDLDEWSFESILIHELGHILGAPHVNDPYHIMHSFLIYRSTDYDRSIREIKALTYWLHHYE